MVKVFLGVVVVVEDFHDINFFERKEEGAPLHSECGDRPRVQTQAKEELGSYDELV